MDNHIVTQQDIVRKSMIVAIHLKAVNQFSGYFCLLFVVFQNRFSCHARLHRNNSDVCFHDSRWKLNQCLSPYLELYHQFVCCHLLCQLNWVNRWSSVSLPFGLMLHKERKSTSLKIQNKDNIRSKQIHQKERKLTEFRYGGWLYNSLNTCLIGLLIFDSFLRKKKKKYL